MIACRRTTAAPPQDSRHRRPALRRYLPPLPWLAGTLLCALLWPGAISSADDNQSPPVAGQTLPGAEPALENPAAWQWQLFAQPARGARTTISAPDRLRLEFTAQEPMTAEAVLLVAPARLLPPGSRVRLSLRGRAAQACSALCEVDDGGNRPQNRGLSRRLQLGADWRRFQWEFTANAAGTVGRWRLALGEATAAVELADWRWEPLGNDQPVATVEHTADQAVDDVVQSEEMILALAPRMGQMARGVMNLALPDRSSTDLFADQVQVLDLAPANPTTDHSLASVAVRTGHWAIAPRATMQPRDNLRLWSAAIGRCDYFEFARFYFIRAQFTDAARRRWQSDMGFEGAAQLSSGSWCWLKGRLRWQWRRDEQAAAGWTIDGWETLELKSYEVPRRLFVDAIETDVPDEATRRRLRDSEHDRWVVRLATEKPPGFPVKYFDNVAFDRHPGVAVVDIDDDGWDELYLMDQWGRNVLLQRRADGLLEDVAPRWGLDIDSHSSSALFADFDNDGDRDLFLGRTLARSQMMINDNGRFSDRSAAWSAEPLPFLVSSLAAADFDQDGLLDVYVSTYAANTMMMDYDEQQQGGLAGRSSPELLAGFLPPAEAAELFQRFTAGKQFTSRAGPPNVLYHNRGDRFERAAANESLAVWRNTYQSTWADYDDDGDPDLYVANDFSENNLFRNEGQGRFADVTAATRTADIGFGMGASFGDYDNDGRQDLYVSNMYSKAGQRITRSLGGLVDPRLTKMAGGNSLFRNLGPHFDKVSGVDPGSLQVEMAGWSWGGQFVDVDNDGYLDLFATSGYYSAPKPIATAIDL